MKTLQFGMTLDSVVGDTLTFSGGTALPEHLKIAHLTIQTTRNPADPEWKPSSVGIKYRVSIEYET